MRIAALQLSAKDMPSLGTITATVVMSEPAGASPAWIMIGTSHPCLKVPHKLQVEPGQTSKSFTIEARTLRRLEYYYIWAQYGHSVARQRIVLRPAGLAEAFFNPSKVEGGDTSDLTVRLDSAAPAAGVLVGVAEVVGYGGHPLPLLVDLPDSIVFTEGETEDITTVTTLEWDAGRMPPPRQIDAAVDLSYGDVTKRVILTITDEN